MDTAVRNLKLRRGESSDELWLFQLFKATMQDHIDAAWGWEELLQKEGFLTSLPARNFRILQLDKTNVGCIYLSEKDDHLLLEMILVEPSWQQQGHGQRLIDWAKEEASKRKTSIELSVIRTNPAVQFHLHNGFNIIAEDEHSLKMAWAPKN